jgi:peptide/nickel transport system ATP-binding protein
VIGRKQIVPEGMRLVVEKLRITLKGSEVDVVDDVSFSVGAREILGLVGESGSGKTSIALALLGYARRGLQLDGGKVLLDGNDMLSASPDHLKDLRGAVVAYVPQDPASALNPTLRVGTQLREALRFHTDRAGTPSEQHARLLQVIADVGLDTVPHLMHAYPHELSGGQQQRATIAMAFALRPQ